MVALLQLAAYVRIGLDAGCAASRLSFCFRTIWSDTIERNDERRAVDVLNGNYSCAAVDVSFEHSRFVRSSLEAMLSPPSV
jgi:hypothetical protein